MRGGRYKTIPSPALPGHLSPRGASVTLDPSTRIYFLVPISELPPVASMMLEPMAYREGEIT